MKRLISLWTILLLVGCAGISVEERRAASERVATETGWTRTNLETGYFMLATFSPPALVQADTLTVYIEGDGLAWVDAHTPSFDPTPSNPLALRLAIRDSGGLAVYLARPCQYVMRDDQRHCRSKYWTSHRFAPEVIESTDLALEQLKFRYGARHLVLVGYSGGGAVAALVAARRTDVARLVTVGGNLDTNAWTTKKRLSPLSASLNPADAWSALINIPQVHYVGGRDKVMGPEFAESYSHRFPAELRPEIVVIPEFDHHCCWTEVWTNLMQY